MSDQVLLISGGWVHPSLQAQAVLRRWLANRPGLDLRRAGRLDALLAYGEPPPAIVVLYVHHKAASDAALARLDALVAQGSGLLAIHSAAASYKQQRAWQDLLGGRFIGHGPVTDFEVQPDERNGWGDRFSVHDELYRHTYAPDVTVRAFTPVDGVNEPVCWTRQHGDGRVAYLSLGHTTSVLQQPGSHVLLDAALRWLRHGNDL